MASGETSSAGRAKHIDVRFKHVAQSIQDGIVRVRYIPTQWNYADIMTKPLGRIEFARIRALTEQADWGVGSVPGVSEDAKDDELEDELVNLIFDYDW